MISFGITRPVLKSIVSDILTPDDLFSPLDLSPVAWFDASDSSTITAPGGLVSEWRDKSGNDRHIAQATSDDQPSYANNSVTFDGVSDYLTRSESFMYSATDTVTIFLVVKSRASTADYMLAEKRDAAFAPAYVPFRTPSSSNTTNQLEVKNDANESIFQNTSAANFFSSTDFKVLSFEDTGSAVTTRANGVSALTVSYTRPALPITLNRFAMGAVARATGSFFSEIDVKELLIFHKAFTRLERIRVTQYLLDKHITPPAPVPTCGTNFGAAGGPTGGYQENSTWQGVNGAYGIVFIGNGTNTAVWRATPVVAAPGSTLTSAVITWDTDTTQPFPAYKHFIMRVYGVKDGRAAEVGAGNLPLDQVLTTAFVDVDISTWTGVNATGYWGPSGDTIDVTAIMNEIIGDPCWVSGNHPQFIFMADSYPVGNAFVSFGDQAGSDPLTLAYS